jgi:glycosyltransferase involved in cell wall biosynthesis
MPTKVLFLIDRLGRGGVAQVTVNAALTLDRSKFAPIICTTRPKPAYGHDALLQQAGIPLIELNRRSRFDLSAWRPLWQVLPSVAILHTHLSGSNFWGRLWGRLFRVPIIVTQEHTAADQKLRIEHLLDRFLSPFSDRIVAVSEFDRQRYIELEHVPPQKIETVYVGIDIARFTRQLSPEAARQAAGLPAGKRLITVVARLFPQKNHQGLLAALLLLPEELRAQVRCLLVGSGDLETQLRQQVQERGLQETVLFLGERSDIPTILWATDLMVLPSHFECLPSVISEAMAAGCPVVATAVGGVPEMLAGVGWPMVPPGDTHALAEAMTAVLQMPTSERERITAVGQQIVRERFSKEQSIARLERLYETLLNKK